jgi:hypothetical protein
VVGSRRVVGRSMLGCLLARELRVGVVCEGAIVRAGAFSFVGCVLRTAKPGSGGGASCICSVRRDIPRSIARPRCGSDVGRGGGVEGISRRTYLYARILQLIHILRFVTRRPHLHLFACSRWTAVATTLDRHFEDFFVSGCEEAR